MNNSVRRIRYLPIALAKASLIPPLKEIAPPDGPFRFEILPRLSGFLPFRYSLFDPEPDREMVGIPVLVDGMTEFLG
ncbi:MAG TPA: hypothetical protein VFI90_18845 [Rubrobacter sp.]|nr:hypothetical protein [Rubrobacter sp.]